MSIVIHSALEGSCRVDELEDALRAALAGAGGDLDVIITHAIGAWRVEIVVYEGKSRRGAYVADLNGPLEDLCAGLRRSVTPRGTD
jgi:hypothetical protein